MTALIIALVLALTGTGAAIVVSDDAKPGDALYGIDLAVESVRLNLSGEDRKNELRVEFAEERLEEVDELITESNNEEIDVESTKNDGHPHENGKDADGHDHNNNLTEKDNRNVEIGLQRALDLLTFLSDNSENDPELANAVERLLGVMNDRIGDLSEDIDVRFDSNDSETDENESAGRTEIKLKIDDDKTKIETRADGQRVKIEMKDGEIKIKTQEDHRGSNKDEDIDSDSLHRDSDNDDGDKNDADELEIEVKLGSTTASVKIEYTDGQKEKFGFDTIDGNKIINLIVSATNLTENEVRDVIEFKTRDEEEDADSDDDSDISESDDEEDDESDDDSDNSGSSDSDKDND